MRINYKETIINLTIIKLKQIVLFDELKNVYLLFLYLDNIKLDF